MIMNGKGAILALKWSFCANGLGGVPKQHLLNREELSWLLLKALEQQKRPLLPLFKWPGWNAAISEAAMLRAVCDARCKTRKGFSAERARARKPHTQFVSCLRHDSNGSPEINKYCQFRSPFSKFLYTWNINNHLLFTKTTKILHKRFNSYLNPFVLACSSTRVQTRMRGWRMRKCWPCNPPPPPPFFLILQLYSFISLLPDGDSRYEIGSKRAWQTWILLRISTTRKVWDFDFLRGLAPSLLDEFSRKEVREEG